MQKGNSMFNFDSLLSKAPKAQKAVDSYLTNLKITDGPLDLQNYPEELKDGKLYDQCKHHPKEAIPELLALLQKYQNHPVLLNYLSAAYGRIGQITKCIEIVKLNYKENPEYLFARTSYALHCIIDLKDHAKIPKIFNNTFIISELYPDREIFHVTEIILHHHILGLYYCFEGKLEQAEACLKILKNFGAEPGIIESVKSSVIAIKLFKKINDLT